MARKKWCYDCQKLHRYACVRNGSIRSLRSVRVNVPVVQEKSRLQRLYDWMAKWWLKLWEFH